MLPQRALARYVLPQNRPQKTGAGKIPRVHKYKKEFLYELT